MSNWNTHIETILRCSNWSRHNGQPCIFSRIGDIGYTICYHNNNLYGEYISIQFDNYRSRELNNKNRVMAGNPYFYDLKKHYSQYRDVNVYV